MIFPGVILLEHILRINENGLSVSSCQSMKMVSQSVVVKQFNRDLYDMMEKCWSPITKPYIKTGKSCKQNRDLYDMMCPHCLSPTCIYRISFCNGFRTSHHVLKNYNLEFILTLCLVTNALDIGQKCFRYWTTWFKTFD